MALHFGTNTALILGVIVACSTQAPHPSAPIAPESAPSRSVSHHWPSEADCERVGYEIVNSDPGITSDLISKLETACSRVGCACRTAGVAYRDGVAVGVSPHKALVLFQAGCELRDWSSCSGAAFMYEGKSGVPADYPKMISYWERGCEHKSWICQNLAFVYVEGIGAAVDYEKATSLMRRSCDAWAPACVTLAHFLRDRAGKPEEAKRVFERACRRDPTLCDGTWPE